jgi:hypothetical protein
MMTIAKFSGSLDHSSQNVSFKIQVNRKLLQYKEMCSYKPSTIRLLKCHLDMITDCINEKSMKEL